VVLEMRQAGRGGSIGRVMTWPVDVGEGEAYEVRQIRLGLTRGIIIIHHSGNNEGHTYVRVSDTGSHVV